MTSTLAQGVGRSPGEPVRPLSVLALSPALLVLLLVGLVLRLTIAYVLFPASGFESDVASYASWAATMAAHGPAGFYEHAGFADYPPAYLYVLWLAGLAAEAGDDIGELIKLPPILLDIAVGYVIYRLVRGWTWPGARSQALALGAAALYLFNPVSFYDSALWGQTDAAGALILLRGLAALIRGNSEGAAALAATAALVKPQFGVVLIPLVAAVLLKRHLLQVGSGPHRRPWAPAGLARWLAREQGPLRLLTAFAAAWVAFFVIALPFGMGPLEYLERMFGTAGGYGYLSVNAFNLWALVAPEGASSLAAGLAWNDDTVPLLGPIPGVAIGATLLVAGFLWGLWRAAVRDDRWTLIVDVTFLAVAFFILPTRVHERYLFPAIALMPLLAAVSRRWGLALVLLSVGAFINFHGILTLPLYGSENVETLPLGELFRTEPWIILSALLQTGVGLWVAWQLRPGLATSPDGFDREAAAGKAAAAATLVAPHVQAYPDAGAPPPVPPPAAYPAAAPPLPLTAQVRGFVDGLVARLSWGSLRRDRSAVLASEPGGRIDRVDLLVVVVLIVLTLFLRGFRLDQPVRMYFDEVYHARTATEFLQHWEYGQPHAIYEFTHPHLAKYAMAWGIRLAGGNEVSRTAELGVPVADALIEPRWAPVSDDAVRNGDRLWVATGEGLAAYDLADGELELEWPLAAGAVGLDPDAHVLYVADETGRIHALDTDELDERRHGTADPVPEPWLLSEGPGAPVERLLATDTSLVAVTLGAITSFDPESGRRLSERLTVGINDVLELPWVERLVVDTRQLPADREAAVDVIAGAIHDEPVVEPLPPAAETWTDLADWAEERNRISELLTAAGPVVVAAWLDDDVSTALQTAIDAGDLPGGAIAAGPLLAAASGPGVDILDARTLDLLDEVATGAPPTALLLGELDGNEPDLYIAAGTQLETVRLGEEGLGLPGSVWMPGEVRDLAWNDSAGLLHVGGISPAGEPTVYVVEPRGEAVFIDVPLPHEPVRLLADTQPQRPESDRTELLALADDGAVAVVEAGRNAFGWRLPGVLFGALTAVLLYLLARVLFARRSVGLISAALVVASGMLLANARIAMNDVYVTAFIVLAVLLFAPLYLRPRRPWTALGLLLGVGLALGLALASKWVALYAIGGLGLLVLFRSALGRTVALAAMVGMTALFGAMAARAAPVEEPMRNWIFLVLMLVLTGLLAAAMVRRPIPFTRAEVVLAVAAPVVAGVVLALLGELTYSGYAFAAAALLAVVAMIATSTDHGPWTAASRPPAPGTSAWLRPGPVHVLPWLFTLGALTVVPLAVYLVGYAPWVELGNAWGLPLLGDLPGLPASTEGGRTIADLSESMYQYHDNLRAEHAASSPWWAWPLDLKPVWFFQERYADDTTGLIYDTGNLVIFWLGLAGMGFSAWAAWRRRSLALTLVVIMWAALWLPWARIDRATFQYHVYASLPFLVTALAYFLAELWHGPSARTWFLARAAAALAIVGVPLLWLLRTPLCILSGTAVAHPDGVACAAEVTRTAQLSEGGLAALLVLGLGAGVAAFLAWRASRPTVDATGQAAYSISLVLVALLTLGGVVGAMLLLDTTSTTGLELSSAVLALAGLVVLALPAWLVLRARVPRRFVLGVIAAALLWLVIWYPNLSGLPLPGDLAHLYQGLLPTWNWDFQFAVNTDPASDGGVLGADTVLVGAITVVFVSAVMYAAWRWGRPADEVADGPPVVR